MLSPLSIMTTNIYLELYCAECKSMLNRVCAHNGYYLTSSVVPPIDFTGFFIPVNLNPVNFVLSFGSNRGLDITQIDKSYLEFLLEQNSNPPKSLTYEVGLSYTFMNAIEIYLGKWYNPNENRWISL
jgi:hypothetical protein